MSKAPVLLIMFNRPDTTARVLEQIAQYQPERLYIAADGPRPARPGEADVCKRVREATLARIDWPCETKTLFREHNLGCKLGVSGAITWFFENEPAGIILEDDCLPEPSFFPFCADLLERLQDEQRVALIGGSNLAERFPVDAGYGFTRYPHVWGWASWRRVWDDYDVELKSLARVLDESGTASFAGPTNATKGEAGFWRDRFVAVRETQIDTWDYQLVFQCFVRRQVAVFPKHNLISNIGFDARATHTRSPSPLGGLATRAVSFPLDHPQTIATNPERDAYVFNEFMKPRSRLANAWRRLFG